MSHRVFVAFCFGLAASAHAFPPPPKDAKPDADRLAKDLGNAFAANLTKNDIDAIVKTVEFPYRTVGGKETKSPDAVKEAIRDVRSAYWTGDTTVAVKDVVAPDHFETWAKDLPLKPEASKTESDRKAVLDHVGAGGRIVALQFTIDGNKDDDLCLLLVKIKDGKASLVGLVD
jgi:hypothetical protein